MLLGNVACVVSIFTSMGGISGAVLLLPFQISILHFTFPSVSATNFIYNIVAIPSGVYRFIKETRDEGVPCILEADKSSKEYRKNWARLVQKIYEVDPLTCPKCGGIMRIISSI